MKNILITLIFATLALPVFSKEPKIKNLEFRDAKMIDVVKAMSAMTNRNIVVTPKASKRPINISLKQVLLKDALDTICRINDMWYRYDEKTNIYRVMTTEEYSKDLVIYKDEVTEVFEVLNANLEVISNALEDLYKGRIVIQKRMASGGLGLGFNQGNSSFNNQNNNSSNNQFNGQFNNQNGSGQGSGALTDASRKIKGDLSVDQLISLKSDGAESNQVSANLLQNISQHQEKIHVSVNYEHNLIVVKTADNKVLSQIKRLIPKLNKPIPQVLLEMKIVEVSLGDGFRSAINFSLSDSDLTGSSNKPVLFGNNALQSGSFVYEYLNDKLLINLELLETQNKVTVLSTPMVIAANNRPAKLFVGEERLIVTGYSSQESSPVVNGVVREDLTQRNIVPETKLQEIGNTIQLIPNINSDGTVTLFIQQETSNVKSGAFNIPVVSSGTVLQLPTDAISSANIQGTIMAKNNNTIVIGGLIRSTYKNTNRKVPLLGDIPLLGEVFKSKDIAEEKSELLLIITPRLINSPYKEESSITKLETSPFYYELFNSRCKSLCEE